jgi:ribose-phosphate pyrophosphokinase
MTLSLYALQSGRPYAEVVAAALGIGLGEVEERAFEDGEHKSRPLTSVRGHDVYVVQSLHDDRHSGVNDKLVRLLFFLATLKDAGADRLTAVVPYLCYARKDRRTKARDPVTTRYVAALFEAVGVDRMVTVDVHNLAAYQNAFRIPAEHLEARKLLLEHVTGLSGPLAVLSPDVGGVKRAEALREVLEQRRGEPVPSGFMEKHRSAGVVSGATLVGDVDGRTVLLVDDLIASGGTLVRAAQACLARGARRVIGLATHGAFAPQAGEVLAHEALEGLVITDTVDPDRLEHGTARAKLTVLPTAPLVAEAVRRLHTGGSLVELLAP